MSSPYQQDTYFSPTKTKIETSIADEISGGEKLLGLSLLLSILTFFNYAMRRFGRTYTKEEIDSSLSWVWRTLALSSVLLLSELVEKLTIDAPIMLNNGPYIVMRYLLVVLAVGSLSTSLYFGIQYWRRFFLHEKLPTEDEEKKYHAWKYSTFALFVSFILLASVNVKSYSGFFS